MIRGIARHVDRVVGIRDGMLASETIRQAIAPQTDANGFTTDEDSDQQYAELVVLDRAGRVHVPQEYLEQFDIKGHAQLEIIEDGILIRPAAQTGPSRSRSKGTAPASCPGSNTRARPPSSGRTSKGGGLFGRFRRKRNDTK